MAAPKIKLLICSITLSLVMGCVPSLTTPTPIPPLDANAIGTFMVQTADAASAQTLAAMPALTSTATITTTPRNTFTPESTFTPVPTILQPSLTPVANFQYYRVKHDNQLAMFDYKSRTYDGNSDGLLPQTPEVVPLYAAPKLTAGTARTPLSGGWETLINSLNNNDPKKLNYLKSNATALFNTAGFPQLESLTMGGNIVRLDAIQNGWGRVSTMDYGNPPNAADVNYVTRPDLIHKFVVVGWKKTTRTTILVNPPKGDLYWPFVSRHTVWIQMDRLEPFPILPMDVTVNQDLYIQKTPGPNIEETKLQLSTGESVKVIAYQPSGSDVWGRVQRGWIPLLLHHQYRTSWTMATVPPP